MNDLAKRRVSSPLPIGARKKRWECVLRAIAIATLCSLPCGPVPWASAAEGPRQKSASVTEGSRLSQKELVSLTPLLVTATRFQAIARLDFEKALLMFCRNGGMDKMWAIDHGLWTIELSQWAWSLFFSSAVHVLGGGRGDSGVVGFYNPYSDAFLLTVWAPGDGAYTLVDAEMLMGDWVRNDNDALDPVPRWLREKVHRPVALGMAVAESILAFERVFETVSGDRWREALPVLKNEGVLQEINYPGLSVMLNNHLINVGAISSRETKDPAVTVCREMAEQLISQATRDKIGPGLSTAVNTLPETAATLKRLKPAWFKALKVSGVLTDPEGTLIFLTPHDQTNATLSLFYSRTPSNYVLRRVDIVDYQTFYSQTKITRQRAGKGGQK